MDVSDRQAGGAEAKAGDGSRPQRKQLNVGETGLEGGVVLEGTCGKPHHCGLTLSSPHPASDDKAVFLAALD